jgi:hypothetical protein
MNSDKIISKTKWVDDLRKIVSQYKSEEFNLTQSCLQTDFHLNKIYKSLLIDEINSEYKNFNSLQKQLKFYINEAYSYIVGKKISKADNFEFQNKINKIENLILKIRNEYKIKFDTLLAEETSLEKELDNYDLIFMEEFAKEQENKLREYYNSRLNKDEDMEMLNNMNNQNDNNMKNYSILNVLNKKNQNTNQNKSSGINKNKDKLNSEEENNKDIQEEKQVYNNLDLIDKYIDKIMTNVNYPIYGINDEEEITFNDIEKLVKKMNQNHLKIIRIKTDIINAIIEKKLGGNNQGWEPKEHEEFIKLKNAYNNRINTYEFLTALSQTIPYIPVSELKNHIYLYEKFVKINDIKKLLLNKYKEIKKKKEEDEKEKKIQKIKEERKLREEQKKDARNKQKIQEERRQKVLEWKQNKEKELLAKQQILYEEKKIQRQKEKEIYYINKIKNHYALEEYHQRKKQEQEEKAKLIEEEKNKLAQNINKFDIDRIKDKEDALLQKKLDAKQVKVSNKLSQEIKYQNYKIKEKEKLKYVPSKLKESTTQSKNRKREKFDPNKEQKKDAYTMANNVLGRTTRAVPSWRQGL